MSSIQNDLFFIFFCNLKSLLRHSRGPFASYKTPTTFETAEKMKATVVFLIGIWSCSSHCESVCPRNFICAFEFILVTLQLCVCVHVFYDLKESFQNIKAVPVPQNNFANSPAVLRSKSVK